MKAVVLLRYGPPATALALTEVPQPTPGPRQVLLKVRASTVNDWDWCYTRGQPLAYRLLFGLRKPKVRVLGAEVAGIVQEVGSAVTRFHIGDAVYGDLSATGFGGFAEYACVDERALWPKPRGLSFEHAAAAPHAAMLAWQGLMDLARLRPGESVLINGAGGGVGILGLQMAKRSGAEVTGVDQAFKLNALRSVGFDHTIDYLTEDFTRSGRRYDVILDTKTTRAPTRYLDCLKPGGRYVTVGGHLPRIIQIAMMGRAVAAASGKQVRVLALKPNQGLSKVDPLLADGSLKSVIDGAFPLRNVHEAVQRFGEARHIGKIVITMTGPSAGGSET